MLSFWSFCIKDHRDVNKYEARVKINSFWSIKLEFSLFCCCVYLLISSNSTNLTSRLQIVQFNRQLNVLLAHSNTTKRPLIINLTVSLFHVSIVWILSYKKIIIIIIQLTSNIFEYFYITVDWTSCFHTFAS